MNSFKSISTSQSLLLFIFCRLKSKRYFDINLSTPISSKIESIVSSIKLSESSDTSKPNGKLNSR